MACTAIWPADLAIGPVKMLASGPRGSTTSQSITCSWLAPNKSDGLGVSREFFDCFDRHRSSRHISAEHDQIDVRALDILKHRAQCVKIPMKIAQHRDSLDQTFLTTEPVLRIMQCPLWIS